MRKAFLVMVLLLASVGLVGLFPQPLPAVELKVPKVELERVEVAHYWPFFLDTKEKRGSPLDLAFIFAIHNPNDFKVMLDDLRFTVEFEPGFEVNTVAVYEDMSIPPKTTNQLRVHAAFDAYTTLLNLLVTGGFRLQEMNVKAPDQVKMWWEKIPDFGYEIKVTNGVASFVSDQGEALVPFEGRFPKK